MNIIETNLSNQNWLEGRSQERCDITWLPKEVFNIRIIYKHGIEYGKRFVQECVRTDDSFFCLNALTSFDVKLIYLPMWSVIAEFFF